MAFGKKKQDDAPGVPAPEAAPDQPPEAEALDAATLGGSESIESGGAAAAADPVAAAQPEAAADPLAGDLLNMFSTTKIEAVDLSVILDLAGEAEMDDLLEELHTVALALGIRLEEVADDDAADLLAA